MPHESILTLDLRKILNLSIFLACVTLLLSCQKQTATSFETANEGSQVREIPKDWQRIETDDFSFSIPPTMKKNDVRGIDSFVMQFENDDFTLFIESGIYTSKPSSQLQNYEGQKESIFVNNQNAEFIIYDLNKPINLSNRTVNADGSSNSKMQEKNFVFGIYIPHTYEVIPINNGSATSFDVISKSLQAKETVKTIFQSIKFKQK